MSGNRPDFDNRNVMQLIEEESEDEQKSLHEDKEDKEDKQHLESLDSWICFKNNIGGLHPFNPPAALTGFYKLKNPTSENITKIVVKRDSRHDRNIIEVFAANFMKGLMDELYESGDLIAHTGFINPPADDDDENKKPYIYSALFTGNVLNQDATAAALCLETSPLPEDKKNKQKKTEDIVPNGPGLSTNHMNLWFKENPDRYNQDYFHLVALSLFVGDPDIHPGNFFVIPENRNDEPKKITLSVVDDEDKEFDVYDNVRVARFDFGGIRYLSQKMMIKPVQGMFHYNPLTGPPFQFAAFPRWVRKHKNIYTTLSDISLLTIDQLRKCIDNAVDSLKGHCTKEDLYQFIKAQQLPIKENDTDNETTILSKINKTMLYAYTARKASCEYQFLEYLLTLKMNERLQFIQEHPSAALIILKLSPTDKNKATDTHIKKLIDEFENNLYSKTLSFKDQYTVYKRFIYKNSDSIILKESLMDKINKRIEKYNKSLSHNTKLNTAVSKKLNALKDELTNESNPSSLNSIHCRYQLIKYIIDRHALLTQEGDVKDFMHGIVGFSAETKINAATKLLKALNGDKGIQLDKKEYHALHDGELGDIYKTYKIKKQLIASNKKAISHDNEDKIDNTKSTKTM